MAGSGGRGKSGSARASGSAVAVAVNPAASSLAVPEQTARDRFQAFAEGVGRVSRGAVEAGRATRRASDATVELGRRARNTRTGQAAANLGARLADATRRRAARDIELLRSRRR